MPSLKERLKREALQRAIRNTQTELQGNSAEKHALQREKLGLQGQLSKLGPARGGKQRRTRRRRRRRKSRRKSRRRRRRRRKSRRRRRR